MSVKIRLTRIGRHKDPIYRIVAADSRFARDGRYIEQIGLYNPNKGPEGAEINEELALKWLAAGATPSDSVRAMFNRKGLNAKAVSKKRKQISMDFEKIIHSLIDPLVEKPENVIIKEIPNNSKKDVTLVITADDEDCARLIGKRGSVANALREAIGICGKADNSNVRVHLRFESFADSKDNGAE